MNTHLNITYLVGKVILKKLYINSPQEEKLTRVLMPLLDIKDVEILQLYMVFKLRDVVNLKYNTSVLSITIEEENYIFAYSRIGYIICTGESPSLSRCYSST